MDRKFKISSLLATLVLGTMLVGCGGSSKDSKNGSETETPKTETPKTDTPKTDTPKVDARQCNFTPAIVKVELEKEFDAAKSISGTDGKGEKLTNLVFVDADKVDTKVEKDYTIKVKSESCDNEGAVNVKVSKKSNSDAPTPGDESLKQLADLVSE